MFVIVNQFHIIPLVKLWLMDFDIMVDDVVNELHDKHAGFWCKLFTHVYEIVVGPIIELVAPVTSTHAYAIALVCLVSSLDPVVVGNFLCFGTHHDPEVYHLLCESIGVYPKGP